MAITPIRFMAGLVLAGFTTALVRAHDPAPRAIRAADSQDLRVPNIPPYSEAAETEIAGLGRGSAPVTLTWDRVYACVLIRARSGNRALAQSLDLETLSRQSPRFGVAEFARFQNEFCTSDVFRDPGPDVLALLGKLQAVDNARRDFAVHEALGKLLEEQIQRSASSLGRIDVDAVAAASIRARERLDRRTREFRDGLDDLKVILGLSPRAAVILDRKIISDFQAVFVELETWNRNANRDIAQLSRLVAKLPKLGDIVLDGQPIFQSIAVNPEGLDNVLARSAQLAVENRGDAVGFRKQENIGVALELKIRRRIRHLAEIHRAYAEATRGYEMAVRLSDQSMERLLRPRSEQVASRSALLERILENLNELLETEDRLVDYWTRFRAERLLLFRDLGILPYQDWSTFYGDLTAHKSSTKSPT
jgi:hypothetical protein